VYYGSHVILWGIGNTYVKTIKYIINHELQAIPMFVLHNILHVCVILNGMHSALPSLTFVLTWRKKDKGFCYPPVFVAIG
jgi:hypothetical protein